nr:MAG TPA: hypothetical protein [Caudoviricetes sp.]
MVWLKPFDVQRVARTRLKWRRKTKCLHGFNWGLRGETFEACFIGRSVCFGLHEVYMGLR